ncbi:hypothetical protein J4421_05160 [Candidatus Woesearchaeota archaeon]|nr:hypothetical protein [Candidatus Woesearchaeota archaeon]
MYPYDIISQVDAYAFEMLHVVRLDQAMNYFARQQLSSEVLIQGEVLEYLMGFYSLSSAQIISQMTERKAQEMKPRV